MRILRGLGGRRLECGCLTGIYETYGGEVVEVLDWHADTCVHANHIKGGAIPGLPPVISSRAPSAPQPPQYR